MRECRHKMAVLGLTAAAERDAIAYLIIKAIRRDHFNSASQPDRPAAPSFWIFDKAYRDGQLALYGFPRRLVPSHQAAGRTIFNLPDEGLPNFGFVSTSYLIPHLSVRITKASECAKALCIRELQPGPVEDFRLTEISFTTGRLGAVKTDLCVGAIAERLFLRLTAPA